MQGVPIAHAERNDVSFAARYLTMALLKTTRFCHPVNLRQPMLANYDIHKRAYLARLSQNLTDPPHPQTLNCEVFQGHGGYMILDLQPVHRDDKQQAFLDSATQNMGSIMGGCYVHPWSSRNDGLCPEDSAQYYASDHKRCERIWRGESRSRDVLWIKNEGHVSQSCASHGSRHFSRVSNRNAVFRCTQNFDAMLESILRIFRTIFEGDILFFEKCSIHWREN
jgi:hypothetical protein